MAQETLVVCLVDSSVNLLHEWGEILLGYISPLLQRIATASVVKGTRNEFRIGFVSYSDPYIHPNPILAKRFFSAPFQLTKELKDEPANLGLGRTASGGRRGMAVLEGYVAVLEMFDSLADTRPPLRPHAQNEAATELPRYEPMCYLIHVASSPPTRATRPSWNMNPALDGVTWASLPSELLKRKIRFSMILTRPNPELAELYSNISRTPEPLWFNTLKPSHKVLLSGLPPILKDTRTVPQKRPAIDTAEGPAQPPPPRPQSQEQVSPAPANPTTAATTSAPSNLPNPSPRPGSVTAASEPQPMPPPQAQPQPQAQSQPQPQAQAQPQSQPQHQPQPQPQPQHQPQPQPQTQPTQPRPNILGQNFDPVKLMNFIRSVEVECRVKSAAIAQARTEGKPQTELDVMQAELNQKLVNRSKLMMVYQQIAQKQQLSSGTGGAPSIQNQDPAAHNLQQITYGPGQQPIAAQEQPTMQSTTASGSGPSAQISPPRSSNANGNTPFTTFGGPNTKNPFQNLPISARPGMEAQMQKMLAERTRPPVLAAAPQSQSQPLPQNQNQNQGPPAQPNSLATQNSNMNPGFPGANPTMGDIMTPRMSLGSHSRRWQGILAWPAGPAIAGGRKEIQIFIALFSQDPSLRPDSWPQKLILQPSRSIFSMQQIQAWNKELNPSMALLSHTPIMGNFEASSGNVRLFRQLRDLIQQKNLLAYCKFDIAGGPPGTGFVTFPMNSQSQAHNELLVAMVFNTTPLPAALTAGTVPQPVPAGPSDIPQPMSAQNMTPEAKAFLQQRQAAALAAYNQQQAVQQAQQQGVVPNPAGGPGGAFNMAPFMPTGADGQLGMGGGLNLPQAPALQQVQHRQPSGFAPGQISSLQRMQYALKNMGEGQGQGQ